MTDTPADYYRRKQQEVDEIIELMEAHAGEHIGCSSRCKVRICLEQALERARYVGD